VFVENSERIGREKKEMIMLQASSRGHCAALDKTESSPGYASLGEFFESVNLVPPGLYHRLIRGCARVVDLFSPVADRPKQVDCLHSYFKNPSRQADLDGFTFIKIFL
jgi:hypothetical protein